CTDVAARETWTLSVSAVTCLASNLGTVVNGTYGEVIFNRDGACTDLLSFPTRRSSDLTQGQSVSEVFHYTAKDVNGATSTTTLTIGEKATNDPPLAVAETNTRAAETEAGVNPGNTAVADNPNASGNLLTNEPDGDATEL